MPTPLTDADKVLRNDTGIDIATNIASIASALTPSNITDLGDVNLTNPITDGQVIKYDTATQKWVNGLGNITMECTQAQYDAWKQSGQLKPSTLYVITDAPNLNATAQDISYDGGADTVWDKVEAKANTSDLPTWITQASGTNTGTIGGASVFGYYYADQWTAYIYLPFIAKNTNYTVTINAVSADNVGDVTSKCSVVAKQNGYFTIRTTKTMPNLPDYYSVCPLRITYSIEFA